MKVLTDWFPGTIKPVHPGPYLAVWHEMDPPTLDVFESGGWREVSGTRIMGQPIRWCGLAFNPEAAVPFYAGIYIAKHGNKSWIVEVPR